MEEGTKVIEWGSEVCKKITCGKIKNKINGTLENTWMLQKQQREVENKQRFQNIWKEQFEELLYPNGYIEERKDMLVVEEVGKD